MGNAKSRNNSNKFVEEISRNIIQENKLTKTTIPAAAELCSATHRREDNNIKAGGSATTTAITASTVGGLSLENTTAIKSISNSNKAAKDLQQLQQLEQPYNIRQQKAADSSATTAVAEQQRLKQGSSLWSLGSLNWNLSFSGRNSYKQRQAKSNRKSYSTLQYHGKRSKTQWHKPLTNAIFSSHFKESSRNEQFFIDQLVAKGAFGVVFKVIDKKSIKEQQQQQQQQYQQDQKPQNQNQETQQLIATCPQVYALKVLKKSKIISENSLQQIKDEVDIQKVCGHHPFIVKQFDLWQNRYNLHILSEYLPNGELFSTIRSFSLNLIRLYLAEIALALDFLHNAGIIYRDAKPENILLTTNFHLKLIDFGLSKWLKLGATTKTVCGTFQYMAPEILRGDSYTHAVDWWSLGVIVCQMFVKKSPDIRQFITINLPNHLQPTDSVDKLNPLKTPFQNADSLTTDNKLLDVNNFLPEEVQSLPHEAKDVLKRLLEFDSQKRIRSVRALQRIAMYKDFKIESQHCLKIRPMDIITADNITLRSKGESLQSSNLADKSFHNF